MINKKLVSYLKEDKKYVYLQVLMQWLALLSQIIIVAIMANMINELFIDQKINNLAIQVIIIIILIFVKDHYSGVIKDILVDRLQCILLKPLKILKENYELLYIKRS